jgi:hypothetical protein
VVARERERRMQQRLAALRAIREPGDAVPPGPAEPAGSLLEAKRRARERFDDGSPAE